MKAFECQMCGECCYGEGGIFVEADEIRGIAGFLGITPHSFLSKFCEERHERTYLRTGPDNFCIFFNREKSCLIHPVKPTRCALWPFFPAVVSAKDNWELAKDACPGINPDCPFEEFVRQSHLGPKDRIPDEAHRK
jgi:Fe-S-cluster containining protein